MRNINNRASRMLSALIAFAMLFSLIPASQITASADDPQQILIDFTQTTTTHDGTKYIITSSPGYTVVEEKSNPGDRRVYTYDGEKTLWKLVRGAGNWFWPRTNEQEPPQNTYTVFTISVDVPVSGYYSMSLQGGLYHAGTIASIYADQTYMGDYSFWDGEYESQGYTFLLGDKKQLNSVYLTQGAHEISFRSRRTPGTQNAQLLLYKLWLDPLDEEPVFDSVAITAPASIEKGSTAILSANALMSNGASYGIAQYNEDGTAQTTNTISIISSNPDVVSVSDVKREIGTPETTAATLTANKNGSATITVSATIEGVTKSAEHQVNVTSDEGLAGVTLTPAKTIIEIGEIITSSVTGVMNDGSAADLTDATITYDSSNDDVATVDNDGNITGVGGGTASITVTVTLGEITFYDTKTITVTGSTTLSGIAVTTPPSKTVYKIGEGLDLTGLVVTGTYTDGSTSDLNVTSANISGFDSSKDNPSQTVTVTVDGKTATFPVTIVRVLESIAATGSITIDGIASESAWANQIKHDIVHTSLTDNTAEFGTLWDEDNLYVFFNVNDEDVINSGAVNKWDDDSVEVYIDGDLRKDTYNSHTAQYIFRYGDSIPWASAGASIAGVEHAWSDTANGYAAEIKIPWSSIGGLTVENGKTIGITVHVNDKDVNNPTLELTSENIMTYTVESDKPYADWQNSRNWAEMTFTSRKKLIIDFSQTTTTHDGTRYIITSSPGYTVVDELSTTGHKQMLTLGTNKILNVQCRGKKAHYWPRSNDYEYPENMWTRFTISVDVPVSGYYLMSLQGALYQEGGIASIYVDETYMGDYSFWDGTFKDNPHSRRMGETKQLNSVYLTAGPHNISFRNRYCPYWHPDGTPAFCLYKLWLDPLDEEAVFDEVIIDMPDNIELGESIDIGAYALMSNGVPYGIAQYNEDGSANTENTVTITSSDSDVTAVSNVRRELGTPEVTNATLTPKKLGECVITAEFTVNGVTKTAQKTVTVMPQVTLDSVSVRVDGDVYATRTAQAIVSGMLTNGSAADLATAEIVFTSSDTGVAEIDVNGIITGIAAGETNIGVSVTLDGVTRDAILPLTVLPAPSLDSVALEIDTEQVFATKTAHVSVSGTLTNGEAADLLNAEIVYTSSDTEVAEINQTGLVTAKKQGQTNIGVSVTLDGATREAVLPLTVLPSPALESVELIIDKTMLLAGETAQAAVTGILTDGSVAGPAAFEGFEISFYSLDSKYAKVDKQSGLISTVAAGRAFIRVNVKKGDIVLSSIKELNIVSKLEAVTVDFTQTTTIHDGTKWIITSSPGYSVIEEKSNPGDRRVYTYDGEKTLWKLVRGAGNWFWPRTNEQEPPQNTYTVFTISVDVPVSGYYSMSLQGGLYHAGTIASIYVDQAYMGDYSFWDGEYESKGYTFLLGDKKQLNSVYLTQGAHEISFRSRRTPGTQNAQLILYKLWLDPLDEEAVFDGVIIDMPDNIELGESIDIGAYALMSNGVPYGIAQYNEDGSANTEDTVTITSSDSDVTAVSNVRRELGTSEVTNATLTPKKPGECVITAEFTVNGVTKTAQKTVVVVPPATLESVSIEIDRDVYATRTAEAKVSGMMTYGKQADLSNANIVFSSSNTQVAEIDENGLITGKAAGGTNIGVSVTLDGITRDAILPLTVLPAPSLDRVILEIDTEQVFATKTANVSVAGTLSNGDEADLTSASIVFSSSDTEVAEINQTGLIAAKKQGQTNIRVSVTLGGATREAVLPLLILPPPSLASVRLILDKSSLLIGETIQARVTGTLTDGNDAGPLDFEGFDIGYQSLNPEYAEVDAGSGLITAVSAGEAVIRVAVSKGDLILSSFASIRVASMMDTITVDFSKTITKLFNNVWRIVSSPGYTVDEEKSCPGMQYQEGGGGFNALQVVVRGAGGRFWPNTNNYDNPNYTMFTIMVDVPAAGYYSISLQGGKWHQGCIASVYMDDVYIGDYDFWDGDTSAAGSIVKSLGEIKRFNSVYLESGVHSISFRNRYIWNNNKNNAIFLHKLFLEPLDAAPVFSEITSNIPEKLAVGEMLTANIYANMSDGAPYHFGRYKEDGSAETANVMSAVNSNNSALGMTGFEYARLGDSDCATAVLTGKSLGASTISVAATVNGETKSRDFYVQVTNEKLGSVEAYIEESVVFAGDTVKIIPVNYLDSGRVIANENVETTFESLTPDIAGIQGDTLVAKSEGTARIKITSSFNGVSAEGYLDVEIISESMVDFDVTFASFKYIKTEDTDGVPVFVKAKSNTGKEIDISDAEITVESLTPDIVKISKEGMVIPVAAGEARLRVSVVLGGITVSKEVPLPVLEGKTAPTIWTFEKRENIKENTKNYNWAKAELNDYVSKADRYVGKEDQLWSMVVPEGLPRYYHAGDTRDPEKMYCRYPGCKANLEAKYGRYPYLTNAMTNPWKIQCPECKRRFPSNDFGTYYKSGLDEHGVFNPDFADRSLLVNKLYPEVDERYGYVNWGVDDGFGYFSGKTFGDNIPERHNPIAYYLHEGLWHGGALSGAITYLTQAYVYTGEAKYGRTGAILLDRIADFYPDYDWSKWQGFRPDGYGGKTLDRIWECGLATKLAEAYDAFFPAYDDPQVVRFLSDKAKQYKMDNPKTSGALIRKNAEDGILREIFDSCVDTSIYGNFGMTQEALATAAIALDTMPETKEWLDWLMRPGNPAHRPRTGGNILPQLISVIDRDGMGNESSPGYNSAWLTYLLDAAELIHDYDKYSEVDLYNNPKFIKEFTAQLPVIMASYYTAQIGDTSRTASTDMILNKDQILIGYKRTGNPLFAQLLYMFNNNSIKGIHEDITVKNPENIQKEILGIIEKYGEFNLGSHMMTGYGLAALRDGVKLSSESPEKSVNTLRDFWIYFGGARTHLHLDSLNLGIDAYGLNMAPDLGYPEETGQYDTNRSQWVSNTISHNTVVINQKAQNSRTIAGNPLHFDDSGRVKVMDVDTPDVYNEAQIYRRTIVMVEGIDDVSYGVDFFRVRGGSDHIYSFHSQSDEVEVDGLNLTAQNGGTYAGPDIEFASSDPTGFTWLDKVRRDNTPPESFSVDFKVKDFRKVLHDSRDLHLRMTMLNDFTLDEVAIARGYPPQIAENTKFIDYLEYVLARRTGSSLDTLFTTVYEPYKGERYIESMESVPVVATDGSPGVYDNAKAVKVVHKGENGENGRVDYIVYSTNNKIKYEIDGKFEFRGFVGVYTMKDDECVYRYINDGDTIGENDDITPAYTGYVRDFTREFSLENKIIVDFDSSINPEILAGKYIYIDNSTSSSPENGVYKIEKATHVSGNTYELDIGDVTVIYTLYDGTDINGGYIYNIKPGQDFRIPLPAVYDTTPVFKETGDKTVDAGSEIRFTVEAESPIGKPLTYKAKNSPRGSGFDPESRTFIWRPEINQVGEHVVAIEATDGALSRTQYIKVKVFTSTLVPKPKDPGGTDGNDAGGGQNSGESGGGGTPGGESGSGGDSPGGIEIPPVTPDIGERFTDLVEYDWARNAIYELADKNIIMGRGDRYAPGENITRADFVLLLTRAFNLTGEGEGFSDVPGGAYYENALKAAKASGIITGIGDNKFNPTGEITREDMMVIVARALEKLGVTLEDAPEDVLNEFVDAGEISDYAKSAVSLLIKNGLIKGTGNRINPKGRATRAEMAVLVHRILTIKDNS